MGKRKKIGERKSRYHGKICDCGAGGFRCEIGFTKPSFVCQRCHRSWSAGRDGHPYFPNAVNTAGKTPVDFVEYVYKGDTLIYNRPDGGHDR